MSGEVKERVRAMIAQNGMIRENDVVCVGCSGGADSTFLLVLLCELRSENAFGFPYSVSACHVNHHLRGDESDGDERFVRDLCVRLGIPLFCYQEDIRARAEKTGTGLEEAGRDARLEAFEDCLRNRGATKIALAHHADDQAETVLYHLARGSALTGLGGMRPVSGPVIRPFLAVTREEIRDGLTARGIPWRTDSSNDSDRFARNRLRHDLIPRLETDVHGGAVRHITQTAEIVRMADDFIEREAEKRAQHCTERSADGQTIRLSAALLSEPEIIRRCVLMNCASALAGRRKDIGRVHIESLLDLFERELGKRVDLPYGIRAFREERGIVLIGPRAENGALSPAGKNAQSGCFDPSVLQEADPVRITGSGMYRFGDLVFEVRIMSRQEALPDMPGDGAETLSVPQKMYTKWLNYDKIKKGLLIRNRLPGDYLVLDEAGRRQKLKSRLINDKIGREIRDRIILIAEESHVYWTVGGRISAEAKVRQDTERVIRITVKPRKETEVPGRDE